MLHIPFVSTIFGWLKKSILKIVVGPEKRKHFLEELYGKCRANWGLIEDVQAQCFDKGRNLDFLSLIQTLEGIELSETDREIEISLNRDLRQKLQQAKSSCQEMKGLLEGGRAKLSSLNSNQHSLEYQSFYNDFWRTFEKVSNFKEILTELAQMILRDLPDAKMIGSLPVKEFGRWKVYDWGLLFSDPRYEIGKETLWDTRKDDEVVYEWPLHLVPKTWLTFDDLYKFVGALKFAQDYFEKEFPDKLKDINIWNSTERELYESLRNYKKT